MSTNDQYIFGLHSVEALLKRQPERVIRLCVISERNNKKIDMLVSLAKKTGIQIDTMSRQELDNMTQHGNHQGVLAFCKQNLTYGETNLKELLQHLEEPPFLLLVYRHCGGPVLQSQ